MGNIFCCIGMSRREADNRRNDSCLCCIQTPDEGLYKVVYSERQCCDCYSYWNVCCWNVGG